MKKNLLFLAVMLMFASVSFAQITIADENGDPIEDGQTYELAAVIDWEVGFLITNNAGSEITYQIEVTDFSGSFGVCGGGTCVDLSLLGDLPANIGGETTLASGATTTVEETHVQYVDVNFGDYVTIHVYEVGNESNSITFTFENQTVGIGEISTSELWAYPNPASDVVNFKYDSYGYQNAKIEIFNLIGKKIQTVSCNSTGVSKIKTDKLETGVYFYNYVVNGKVQSSKKLIISK